MILIVTHKEDYTVDYVANILNKRKLEFFRLNTEDLSQIDYCIEPSFAMSLNLQGKSNFNSTWFRRVKLPQIEQLPVAQAQFISKDYESLLYNLVLLNSDKIIVSNPYRIFESENKLKQLKVAQELGFIIPKTIVTSSRNQIQVFISQHQSSIIKPLRIGRLQRNKAIEVMFTSRVDTASLDSNLALTPFILQEEVSKEYEVRATVVGDSAFFAKVESQLDTETTLDWRKKKLKFTRCKVPIEIEEKCISLVHQLGLKFGAIDLAFTKDGQYVFFEINPNGQWVWIEIDTQLPISEALITMLTQ